MHPMARRFWLLAWLSLMGLLTLYFHARSQPTVTASGELLLKADASGHYRLEGAINGQSVQLLLDTGATRVTVPRQVAERIGLSPNGNSLVNTAAGTIQVQTGQIETLVMGPLTLYDLPIYINPAADGDEILVGMNALGRLELRQKDRQLLLRPLQE
ncbi:MULTISPECIES: retropepsin-like aspartic protease family protein [Aeromonas]|uniref:Retroviral-like aspartic protease family protein n=1 Tax=Aeromonas bestiarum TaxID=105751 RepID=A0ABT7PYV1_9GAMM|nr:retropepsin-like aspartic protease [Aeromonas bestiarum]MDM5072272.1 retroviral-like aspartic protease family protein [Aeromonas bestiarum]